MSTKSKCAVCGKKGKRNCPALDGMICTMCCGSKRGSGIQCTSDCRHYPLSITGYELFLKIDETLTQKKVQYIVDHYGKDGFKEAIDFMSYEDMPGQDKITAAAGSAVAYLLFNKRDKQGLTLAEKWQKRDWEGLNNDERVIMQYRRNTCATVIEVQKVLDYQSTECIDLFDPERKKFIIYDRSFASSITRFTQLLSWLTHYPHFSSLNCWTLELPDTISREYRDALMQNFQKEKRRRLDLTVKHHFAENFGAYCRLCFDMVEAKRKAIFDNMDVHQCIATYVINNSSEIETIIEKFPEFEWDDREPEEGDSRDTLYYRWLRRGASKELEEEMPTSFRHEEGDESVGTIGNLTLHSDKLVVETFTRQKYGFAKKMVERYFGNLVALKNEKVVDLAKQVADREDDEDDEMPDTAQHNTVPLEVEQAMLTEFYSKHYKKFLNDEIPILDGKTPRQAAGDPDLRPKLIELMKLHLKSIDKINKEKAININTDWMLDELSLPELKG